MVVAAFQASLTEHSVLLMAPADWEPMLSRAMLPRQASNKRCLQEPVLCSGVWQGGGGLC